MKNIFWTVVAAFIVVVGGFFSLGLWAQGVTGYGWKEPAFLGVVMFSLSIGVGAIVYLLGKIASQVGN